jgi:PHP family Zn ribbon phosphoesterase
MMIYRSCECGRGILKGVYERVTEQGVWKITTDQKQRELYKTPDLVADTKRELLSEWGLWSAWTNKYGRKYCGQQIRW